MYIHSYHIHIYFSCFRHLVEISQQEFHINDNKSHLLSHCFKRCVCACLCGALLIKTTKYLYCKVESTRINDIDVYTTYFTVCAVVSYKLITIFYYYNRLDVANFTISEIILSLYLSKLLTTMHFSMRTTFIFVLHLFNLWQIACLRIEE